MLYKLLCICVHCVYLLIINELRVHETCTQNQKFMCNVKFCSKSKKSQPLCVQDFCERLLIVNKFVLMDLTLRFDRFLPF